MVYASRALDHRPLLLLTIPLLGGLSSLLSHRSKKVQKTIVRRNDGAGGKLDRAIYGPSFDVESACACDDVCRQSHDHRLGGEHDRGGISARSYPGRFWDYARFGIPITILTTAAGVAVLLVLR